MLKPLMIAYLPPFARQIIADAIETERQAAVLTRLAADWEDAATLRLLAEDRFSWECALASRTVYSARSKFEVFAEVARETIQGFCEWPGVLTPRAEMIRHARWYTAFGG